MPHMQPPVGDCQEGPEGFKWQHVFVKSHLAGVEGRSAKLAKCHCDSEWFFLFVVDGQDHFHMQCSQCGWVYCTGTECAEEAAEEERLKKELEE